MTRSGRVQGHVLLPTTRQEIHLITCEAENGGVGRQSTVIPSSLPVGGCVAGGVRAMREQWQRAKEWEQFNSVWRTRGESKNKCD